MRKPLVQRMGRSTDTITLSCKYEKEKLVVLVCHYYLVDCRGSVRYLVDFYSDGNMLLFNFLAVYFSINRFEEGGGSERLPPFLCS